MGFFLGEHGYYFVEGPSGAGGHTVNAAGFDGVAYNPRTRHLIVYDNKSWKAVGSVGKATAIDPKVRLSENLAGVIARLEARPDIPNQAQILDLLRRTRTAVVNKQSWPANVEIAVTNAGGQSTGVGPSLASSGIKFRNYYQAPQPRWRSALKNQDVAAAIGSALGAFAQWLGDKWIERELRRRLENDLAPTVRSILARGDGVLVIIHLQEWSQADFQGRRAHMLLGVYVHGGSDENQARESWENTPGITQAPPKGWRVVSQYAWIPPLQ